MKAVLQAAWLLTVAGGNLIVVIIAEGQLIDDQVRGSGFTNIRYTHCWIETIYFEKKKTLFSPYDVVYIAM